MRSGVRGRIGVGVIKIPVKLVGSGLDLVLKIPSVALHIRIGRLKMEIVAKQGKPIHVVSF